ncbi:uncharacterized protein LOC128390496 [Panonychus citri]|uniref:uncharacterized protein LOC128390496 n=1 Tax=Panonychus citri TaxID=50023 RepID=UPI0023081A9A|nr:uncharacterized protein LOC128390496 [Panonychus citri]
MSSILYVFLRNKPLNWTSDLYSYLQSINYLLGGCTLLIMVPLVQKFIPRLVNDDLFALMGFTSRAVGLIAIGLAHSSLHAFLTPLGFIFSELTLPSLKSIVSKIVDADEKGKAFAFLGLLSNVTFLLGSQISSLIYYKTLSFSLD